MIYFVSVNIYNKLKLVNKTMDMDTNELKAAFEKFKIAVNNRKKYTDRDDNVLIIDGTNLFIRNWIVNDAKDEHGEFIGGAIGFIRSLGSLANTFLPTRIIVVFDGQGGSQRRKAKYGQYKEGRVFRQKTSDYHTLGTPEQVRENMQTQFKKLVEILSYLPLKIIMIDNIEADDVIAYMAKTGFKNEVMIVSGDNDYLQLIDERICVYSIHIKKKICNDNFKTLYGYDSKNFIWQKVLLGDSSDNIDNIDGIGAKSITVLHDFLNEMIYTKPDDFISKLTDYIDINETIIEKKKLNKIKKVLKLILENRKQFDINFEIMQLCNVDISDNNKVLTLNLIREDIKLPNLNSFRTFFLRYPNFLDFNSTDMWYKKNFSSLIRG